MLTNEEQVLDYLKKYNILDSVKNGAADIQDSEIIVNELTSGNINHGYAIWVHF